MQYFAIIIPSDSSVTQANIEEHFDRHLKLSDQTWFVATDNTTPSAIMKQLGIGAGHEAEGVVATVSLHDLAGFADAKIVDSLVEWRNLA